MAMQHSRDQVFLNVPQVGSEGVSVECKDGNEGDEEAIPAACARDSDDSEPVPVGDMVRAGVRSSRPEASSGGEESNSALKRSGNEAYAEFNILEKKDDQKTVEVPQMQCVDEIIGVPVVAQFCVEDGWAR